MPLRDGRRWCPVRSRQRCRDQLDFPRLLRNRQAARVRTFTQIARHPTRCRSRILCRGHRVCRLAVHFAAHPRSMPLPADRLRPVVTTHVSSTAFRIRGPVSRAIRPSWVLIPTCRRSAREPNQGLRHGLVGTRGRLPRLDPWSSRRNRTDMETRKSDRNPSLKPLLQTLTTAPLESAGQPLSSVCKIDFMDVGDLPRIRTPTSVADNGGDV